MVASDEPIELPSQDALGRSRLAETIAAELRSADASQGLVVGIHGPWGSGKTSLINLICAELSEEPSISVVQFNPWMFSGTDQLLASFFVELAIQLGEGPTKAGKVADALAEYGETLVSLRTIPVLGLWAERAGTLLKFIKRQRSDDKGVQKLRAKVTSALRDLGQPIVVVVDDIDRLEGSEVREIFKLVRLTGNFPNLVYLVAFDRRRVESALDEDAMPGNEYLEKIIQVGYDLPVIPSASIRQLLIESMTKALANIPDQGTIDTDRWPNVLLRVLRPLVRNVRDIKRYCASLPVTVRTMEGKVELVDIFALEAIRVFLPNVFRLLAHTREALTSNYECLDLFRQQDEQFKEDVLRILAASGDREPVVRAFIELVFPAAAHHFSRGTHSRRDESKYLKAKRVAHPDWLSYYFENVASARVQSMWRAEDALTIVEDPKALEGYFTRLDSSEREGLLMALSEFCEEFPTGAATHSIPALINIAIDVPERVRGFLEPEPLIVVRDMIQQMLSKSQVAESLDESLRAMLPEVTTLSGKWMFLTFIGQDEQYGLNLLKDEVYKELGTTLREEIRRADAAQLARETHLYWLIDWERKSSDTGETRLDLGHSPQLLCALLKASVFEQRRDDFSGRPVHAQKLLRWERMVELFGGEEAVRSTVENCRSVEGDADLTHAIGLAERYLLGERPDVLGRFPNQED